MSLLNPQLEAFIAVVKHQTVLNSAKHLGITQTGVTQRIRSLETSLGTTLFIRSRKGMRLTSEGESLLQYCQAASELAGETLSKIVNSAKKREIRVCISGPTSIMSSRVVPQCIQLKESFPNLLFTFDVSDIEARDEALKMGAAQLALLPVEQVARELDSKILKPEKYILVGTSAWKGRKISEIVREERIIDFDPTDQMSFSYLKKFKLIDSVRPERHFVNNNDTLIRMFQAGMGYGVLTQEVARPYFDRGELMMLNGGAAYENRLALAWYPRPKMPDYFRALVRVIQ